MMLNAEIGVLLLFFNKVESTERVLRRILEVKPQVLLLAQDGAREGNDFDKEKVPKCRERVEELLKTINWDCKIYKNYSEENLSCDPKEYASISWAFDKVDKLIVIEDDCLCSTSFFRFMEEMLFRYEKDDRISMISGMERFGENPYCKHSYYFTQASCGCGWGTWRRIWKEVEEISKDYEYVDNMDFMNNLELYVKRTCLKVFGNYTEKSRQNRDNNRTAGKMLSWEFALSTSMVLNSRLAISPAVNLVENIGIVPGATHSGNDINTIPKRNRRIFELKAQELQFPLNHPKYMVRDMSYEALHDKVYKPCISHRIHDDFERAYLLIRHGYAKECVKGMVRRARRLGK